MFADRFDYLTWQGWWLLGDFISDYVQWKALIYLFILFLFIVTLYTKRASILPKLFIFFLMLNYSDNLTVGVFLGTVCIYNGCLRVILLRTA